MQQLEGLGWNVKFDGHHQFEEIHTDDDPPIGILKNPRFVSKVCQAVAKAVGGHAAKGELPVTLGGDHSLVWRSIVSILRRLTQHAGHGHYLGHLEVNLLA